jgi:hypothetical protein
VNYMKKFIALFSVFALALSASIALADNNMVLVDDDDGNHTQVETIKKRLNVNINKNAKIKSQYNLGFNTGAGTYAAADDWENLSVSNGDINVNMTDDSDVNGTDFAYTGFGDDGDTNNLDALDADDTVTVQVESVDKEENLNLNSNLDEGFELNANANTGADSVLCGGDCGDHGDEGIDVSTGSVNFNFDRSYRRNIDFLTRI